MYFFEQETFIKDVRRELKRQKVEALTIATAYISEEGVKYIRALLKDLHIPHVTIYCSPTFSETAHRTILTKLLQLADVYIVQQPFLHAKVFELKTDKGYICYCGSANVTAGGLRNNTELMVKQQHQEEVLAHFWTSLYERCVIVDERVIEVYDAHPVIEKPHTYERKVAMVTKALSVIFDEQIFEEQQGIEDFYFNAEDYTIFNEKYWQDTSTAVQQQRKRTQQKMLALHEQLEPFANAHNVYAHYHPQNITSTITPSVFNFYRVTGIWMRYGKHKSELDPFKKGRRSNKDSPLEQFHKHACLQLTIGEDGIGMGMFHSTATEGIDRAHVDENWDVVRAKIKAIYPTLQGYHFLWTIYSNRLDETIATCELDQATADEFLQFYRQYDADGYESFCLRYFALDDAAIKTEQAIVSLVKETFTVMMPLYEAMTFRMPIKHT